METIWLLSVLDRWDEYNPWDVVGYVKTEKEAGEWVSKGRPGYRKSMEIKQIKEGL